MAGSISGLLAFLSSFVWGSIFHVRNLQIVGLMFLIALAVNLENLWNKRQKYVVLIFLLIYFFNFLLILQAHYFSPNLLLLKFQ